jgi:hypothetical protein
MGLLLHQPFIMIIFFGAITPAKLFFVSVEELNSHTNSPLLAPLT